MKVGLVLGAGGAPGAAFHAAALAALELDLGWDPRSADVVVGTSAGSLAGMMLALGVSGIDMAAFMARAPHHAEHPLVREGDAAPPDLPPGSWFDMLPTARADMRRVTGALRHLLGRRPLAAWASLLGPGRVELRPHLGFVDEHSGDEWPSLDLRVCAVRASDHSLVVWAGDGEASLAEAVCSSCSVPGYASAVTIGREEYIDGGVRSPTNADVLADEGLDLVIISSPMTPIEGGWLGPGRLVAEWAEGRLRRELAVLEGAGTEVVVLRSPPGVAQAATSAAEVGSERAPEMVGESFIAVGPQLATLRGRLGERRQAAG